MVTVTGKGPYPMYISCSQIIRAYMKAERSWTLVSRVETFTNHGSLTVFGGRNCWLRGLYSHLTNQPPGSWKWAEMITPFEKIGSFFQPWKGEMAIGLATRSRLFTKPTIFYPLKIITWASFFEDPNNTNKKPYLRHCGWFITPIVLGNLPRSSRKSRRPR